MSVDGRGEGRETLFFLVEVDGEEEMRLAPDEDLSFVDLVDQPIEQIQSDLRRLHLTIVENLQFSVIQRILFPFFVVVERIDHLKCS